MKLLNKLELKLKVISYFLEFSYVFPLLLAFFISLVIPKKLISSKLLTFLLISISLTFVSK